MVCQQVAGGGRGLQIGIVGANILNKRARKARGGWGGGGRGPRTLWSADV